MQDERKVLLMIKNSILYTLNKNVMGGQDSCLEYLSQIKERIGGEMCIYFIGKV